MSNLNKIKKEFRELEVAEITRMVDEDGETMISGYAAKYESLSEDLGGFREKLAKGAFTRVLAEDPDVRLLFNHDTANLLARTASGTLSLDEDETGLRFNATLPNTEMGKQVSEGIRRGDLTGMSFGFSVEEDDWHESLDGLITRTIKSIKRLVEISAVSFPAYPDTSIAMRGLNEFKNPDDKPNTDLSEYKKRLEEIRGE